MCRIECFFQPGYKSTQKPPRPSSGDSGDRARMDVHSCFPSVGKGGLQKAASDHWEPEKLYVGN